MKGMTELFSNKHLLIVLILLATVSACSKKCKEENPRARITNNGTDKADVQIKTSGGNTENINGILSGQVSDWRSYAPGLLEFTISVQGVSPDTIITVGMEECWEYNIVIDGANHVSSYPSERR